jgi:hypothetical protein
VSHVTVSVAVVVPVMLFAVAKSELATSVAEQVAAAQVGVFVHDDVTAPLSAVHVMVAVPE